MDIVKKNLLSVICGAASLIALLAALVWPIPGYQGGLEQQVQKSLGQLQEVEKLDRRRFSKPIVDINDTQGGQAYLTVFPNPKIIEDAHNAVDGLKTQAKAILAAAAERCAHYRPLYDRALPSQLTARPQTPDEGAMINFRDAYEKKLAEFRDLLNASRPPTQNDIVLERDARWKAFRDGQREDGLPRLLTKPDGTNNEVELRTEFDEKQAPQIPMQVKMRIAQNFTTYLCDRLGEKAPVGFAGGANTVVSGLDHCERNGSVPGLPAQGEVKSPDYIGVWTAQVAMWVQQDVVEAIVLTNHMAADRAALDRAGANATLAALKIPVTRAIVKRLVRIDAPRGYITPYGTGDAPLLMNTPLSSVQQATASAMGGQVGQPQDPALAAAAQPAQTAELVPRLFNRSCTGRVSNRLYDVVHFTVVVDVDAARYQHFIANLTNGKLITVLDTDLKAIDLEKAQERGFVYGSEPVVQLKLKCEAIFMRTPQYLDRLPRDVNQLLTAAWVGGAGTGTGGIPDMGRGRPMR
jgi:hypothetical protein